MKKTLKSQLLAAVSLMLIAAIALTGATYAWFTNVTNPEVRLLDLYVRAADSMFLSEYENPDIGNTTLWNPSITKTMIDAEQGDAFPDEIFNVSTTLASAGALTTAEGRFFLKKFNPDGSPVTGAGAHELVPQKDNYVMFDLWVKSTNAGYIYLDASNATDLTTALAETTSSVIAINNVGTQIHTQPSVSIATTVRVGFVPYSAVDSYDVADLDYAKSVIWEPNAEQHLPNALYGGPVGSGALPTQAVNGTTSGDVTGQKTVKILEQIPLFTYNTAETKQRFRVFIWVEGGDPDTVNAVAKNYFRTYLQFGQSTDLAMPASNATTL